MSAGALPRLQKTEPWELIQAFSEALDRSTLQQADLRNRQDIQAMKESGEDRRLERGSQLQMDRLSNELKVKEPYQQRAEERSHGYDLDKMNKQGDITRQNYRAYGDESMRQHQTNRTFDIEQDLQYAPRQRESKTADLLAKEDIDKLAQQRRLELEYQDAERRDKYARSNRPADDEHALELKRREGELHGDQEIKHQERLTPEIIKRQKAAQEAMGERQKTVAEIKAAADADKQAATAALKTSLQVMRGNQAMEREHFKAFRKAGAVRMPLGVIAVDPAKKLAHKMNGVDYDDPNQFTPGGIGQNPFDPKLGSVQFYMPKNPLDPALLQALQEVQAPPVGGVPTGGNEERPYQDVPQRPPETVQPAIPVTPPPTPAPTTEGTSKGDALEQLKKRLQGGGAAPPPSNFGVDDLKRGNQSEYQTPLEQLRMMVASANPYQSFRDATANIAEPRLQSEQDRIPTTVGNVTTVQKGVQADANSPRGPVVPDIAAPVTRGTPEPVKSTLDQGPLSYAPKTTDTEGKPREVRPENTGYWRITAAEAPPHLREEFERAGKEHNLNPDILAALTHHESISWKPSVIEGRQKSRAGAIGIAQFMPGTAQEMHVDPYDIRSSVDGAARYIKKNLAKFDNNLGLALAAYNQGPGGVARWARSGDASRAPGETQKYVADITGRPLQWWANKYAAGGSQAPGTMVGRRAPLPPARPDNLTTVAKGEQLQGADEEAPVQEAPATTNIPVMRPPDADVGTPGNTLSGLPFEGAGTRPETKALIFHHTGSPAIRSVDDTRRTLERRGLGIQYIMERDGTIHQMAPDLERAQHILRGQGIGAGLSNQNTIGIEIVANDDKDVTPAQVESAKNFYNKMSTVYPGLQVFGHGEINKHKQRTEGGSAARAARQPRVERTNNPDLFYVDV